MSVNWPLRTLSTNLLGKVSAAGDNVSPAWVGGAWVGSWICGHGLLAGDHVVFVLGGVLAHDTVAGCRDGDITGTEVSDPAGGSIPRTCV